MNTGSEEAYEPCAYAWVPAVQRHINHEKPSHTITTNMDDQNAKDWNAGDLEARVIG